MSTLILVASDNAVTASLAAALTAAANPAAGRPRERGTAGLLGETAERGDPLGGRGQSSGLSLPLAAETDDTSYLLAAALAILVASAWLVLKRRRSSG